MPKLANIEGQPMLELSREEVFGLYLNMGHGKEYAERMTRTVMTDYNKIYFGKIMEQREAEQFRTMSQDRCHTTNITQEHFLKTYITLLENGKEYELRGDLDTPITIKPEKEKKPLPKWCGGRQSWRKKKKKWREGKCRTTE